MTPSLKHRFRLSGLHLLWSLALAALVALLVFGIWFPAPFRELSGGRQLFGILVAVDVMLGPCATFVISRLGKSQREWRMDVSLVVLLQALALGYGVWTMYQARPVYLAFEIDRLRVIHAVDVPPQLLSAAPASWRQLPMTGPGLVAVRPFRDEQERMDATLAAIQGVHLGARPDLWMSYADAVPQILNEARQIDHLVQRKPETRFMVNELASRLGVEPKAFRYLPLAGRGTTFWTAVIDANTGLPLAYWPVDPD